MKNHITIFAFTALIISLLSTAPVFAESVGNVSELQTLIQQLQEQVLQLKTRLVELEGELTAVKEELKFQKTLRKGLSGEEVKKLQEFLKNFPEVYPEGLVTGFFGELTEKAVKKFQEKHEIESVGVVGPKTLKKLNEIATGAGDQAGRREEQKIVICHLPPGEPSARHTIVISKSALEAHLAHGDTTGECPLPIQPSPPPPPPPEPIPTPALTPVPTLQAPSIIIVSLPIATVQMRYLAELQASGGVPTYTWRITQGVLPKGLALDSSTGVISGLVQYVVGSTGWKTFPGITYLIVEVTDSAGSRATKSFNLEVKGHVDQEAHVTALTVQRGAEKNWAYGWRLGQLNISDSALTLFDQTNYYFTLFSNDNNKTWYYNKYGAGATPDHLSITVGDFDSASAPNERLNKTLDVKITTDVGEKIIYFPAIPSGCDLHYWEFYVARDGSTYYGRKDHRCGFPDLSPEEALKPEHLARGASVAPDLSATPISASDLSPNSMRAKTLAGAEIIKITPATPTLAPLLFPPASPPPPPPSTATTTATATLDKPDLTIQDIYIENNTNYLSLKLSNIGTAAAPDTGHLYIWIDDVLKWTYSFSTFASTQRAFLSPGGITIAQPQALTGEHRIKATIDPNNAIAESNETNNTLEKTVSSVAPTISVSPTPTTQSPVTVISPNGGECRAGIFPITWASPLGTAVAYWDLSYSLNNGSPFLYMAYYHNYNVRSYNWATYDWTTPDNTINSNQAIIKVQARGPTFPNGTYLGADTSDNIFSLSATCPGGTPPATPTNLTATPKTLSNGVPSVDLTWIDNSANEVGFATYQRVRGSSQWKAPTPTDRVGMNYQGLQAGTTYEFRVRAGNQYGYSLDSNIVSATFGSISTTTSSTGAAKTLASMLETFKTMSELLEKIR